jgi:hypothetical protein
LEDNCYAVEATEHELAERRKALQDTQKAVGDKLDDMKDNNNENDEIENDGSESTLEQQAVSSFIFAYLFYANIKVRVHPENLQSSR